MTDPLTLSLSLVSHTNVGKTALARTLLGRDIGEVRDQAHVTAAAESHSLVESPAGDRLLLWDTPGFGDSLRLARRLQWAGRAAAGNPAGAAVGWLLSEVWDRWRDRSFWAGQHALRNVLEQADVVLYLVNATEAPEDAAYLAPELQVLALLGKPVVVLLNQLGAPGSAEDEALQVKRWRDHLAALPGVGDVLPLDAFARCWVQERVLLQAVERALPVAARPALSRLTQAWALRQTSTWHAAMALLAERLARAAFDRERLVAAGWRAPLRQIAKSLRSVRGRAGISDAAGLPDNSPQAHALAALALRLDADIRRGTELLIQLHGLRGHAGDEVLAQLARHFARRVPVDEGQAALWGGLVSGALAGLGADLASGGLTLGAGLLAGGVLGALGAAGAARGVNRLRGLAQPLLAWEDSVLDALCRSALLGYLAVAHHGRGRGDWQPSDAPAAWVEAVDRALAALQPALDSLWQQRQAWLVAVDPAGAAAASFDDEGRPAPPPTAAPLAAPPGFVDALQALLLQASAAVLAQLYPEAAALVGLTGDRPALPTSLSTSLPTSAPAPPPSSPPLSAAPAAQR